MAPGGGVKAATGANLSGTQYTFSGWSDKGTRTHQVTSFVSLGLIAHYSQPGAAAGPGVQPRQSVVPGPFGRLRLVSKPAGVRLRVGGVGAIAPFSVRLPLGRHTYLLAPRSIERQGRVLHFERWMSGGRGAGTARRHRLTVHEHGRYVAVFGVD